MMSSVYLKTLYNKRLFVLGWMLGFMALAALMVSFFPAMRSDGSLDALIKDMPPAFQGLVGDLALLRQFDTYLASQLFDIRVSIIAGIMAIILGLSLSIASEEKGELRTILSLPISRTKYLLQNWLAMLTITAVVVSGLVIGTYATMPFINDATISSEVMLQLVVMTWLVIVTLGSLPFCLGFATGKRAIASGISILVIIGSFLLSTFSQAVDWLKDYEILSLFHYFPAVEIVQDGVDFVDVLVYGVIIAVLMIFAVILFRRRDVA